MAWEVIVNDDASVQDTVDLIVSTINNYSNSAFVSALTSKLISESHDTPEFLQNLFNYVCENVRYQLDPEGHEKVTTPWRLIQDGVGDCKKITVLIAAVLNKAGIPPMLKVISYDGKQYEHIYVIVPTGGRNYIVMDPVNKCRYNKELAHKSQAVIDLNGNKIDMPTKLSLLGRLPGQGNVLYTDNRFSNWLKGVATDFESDLHSVSGPPPIQGFERGAFLILVNADYEGIRDKMMALPQQKLLAWWQGIDGYAPHLISFLNRQPSVTGVSNITVDAASRVTASFLLQLIQQPTPGTANQIHTPHISFANRLVALANRSKNLVNGVQ